VLGALAFILLAILVAVAAPVVAPYDPEETDLMVAMRPPSWVEDGAPGHVLGTDQLGRDILSRVIYGARISLLVGFVAVLGAGLIGVLLGLAAGYHGGVVDDVIMRIADIQLAFPYILLAVALVAVLGPSLLNVILVLCLVSWVGFARIVRAEVLAVREREFVEAGRSMGLTTGRLLARHILPNVMTPVIVVASFALAQMIITEAALGFLGLGVQPPTPTWGGMLAEGRDYISFAWWLTTFPGLAIMVTVLAINFVGDWLRDYLDPRIQA
jgi:peptide/nickel transport system permease protein